MEKIRVLLVSPLPPPIGGIARWTESLLNWNKQHECLELRIVNTALVGVRKQKINSSRNVFEEIYRTIRIMRDYIVSVIKNELDIIHINTNLGTFGLFRDYLLTLMNFKRIPVVIQIRCNIEDQVRNKISKYIFLRLMKKSSKILVLNEFSRNYLLKENIDSIALPNFININEEIKQKRVNKYVKNVLFVGHVQESKGIKEILYVSKKFVDINFIIVGPIKSSDLTQQASGNVLFLGEKSKNEIFELMAEADIFLFPSHTEGFSNALLEAMLYGLPIIATNVGANKEMIGNDGGIIVGKKDAKAIIDAINYMINNPQARAEYSKHNNRKAVNEYSIEVVTEKLIENYKDVTRGYK